jgi:NAD(P)H-flavin reductase
MVPTPYRVRRVAEDTHDTFTLELDVAGRGTSWAYEPGQFNMLYVFGVGEVPISISGDLGGRTLEHTTREVGAVTRALRRVRRGDSIGVRGPFGAPWPVAQAAGRDVVLIAGGIGLAPLRPIVREIARRRQDFGRVVLLYGTRTPPDVLFGRELAQWRSEFRITVEVTVDRATQPWPGHVGVVTNLVPRAPFDPPNALAFLCGPEIMMRFAAAALVKRGLDDGRIFVSLERNMKCAVGVCGHCQLGPTFVCRDGPVFPWPRVRRLLEVREL